MSWPWEFQDLSEAERHARRLVLDRYGHYSLLFSATPVLVTLAARAVQWTTAQARVYGDRRATHASALPQASGHDDDAPPDSPSLKSRRRTPRGSWEAWGRRAQWWLADDVVVLGRPWGERDLWLGGGLWMGILLVLCVAETGRDYLHVTKRLGIVAIAQLPMQYVLVMRRFTPLPWLVGATHERLNRWHRVLGAIVYTLLTLHTAAYLNFFLHTADGLLPRLRRPVIVLGLLAFAGLTLLSTTALGAVRRWSYRIFFIIHVLVASAMPVLIFFHASSARPYVAAALLLLAVDVLLRRVRTITTLARIETLPGSTSLVRLTAPLPAAALAAFRHRPGGFVYLSLPHAARPQAAGGGLRAQMGSLLFELLFNPFTVAAVDERTAELTLVARARRGPMTAALRRHATPGARRRSKTSPSGGAAYANVDESVVDDDATEAYDEDVPDLDIADLDVDEATPAMTGASAGAGFSASVPISMDGPYGGDVATFAELTPRHFDRVLLVAGGVGATFIVPLYRALSKQVAAQQVAGGAALKVDFVWAVRSAGDAAWATGTGVGSGAGADSRHNLAEDSHVHIFVTGSGSGSDSGTSIDGQQLGSRVDRAGVELATLRHPHSSAATPAAPRSRFLGAPTTTTRQRPELRQIVDDVFRYGSEERVAVLVCGPAAMVQDLRRAVGVWVHRGRVVWWHNEAFGW